MATKVSKKGEQSGNEVLDVQKSYAVLDRVVTHGFDYVGVQLCGHRYVLKTLSSSEEEAVRVQSFGLRAVGRIPLMLAYGTYMLDGVDQVQWRTKETLDALLDHYVTLPYVLTCHLHDALHSLSKRLDEAYSLFQGYLFSGAGRSRWHAFKTSGGRWGTNTAHLGVVGTSLAGEAWARGNRMLDLEEASIPQWDHTFYVASTQNPKGAKESATRLKNRQDMMHEEREALTMYGSFENRDTVLKIRRKSGEEPWTSPLTTGNDLVAELNRQIRGERDRHDLFVAEYFRRQAVEAAARMAAELVKQEEHRKWLRENRQIKLEGQREATQEENDRLNGRSNVTVKGKRVLRGR